MATETSFQTRMLIVQLKEEGLSFPAIAARLALSVSCVKKFYYRFCELAEHGLVRRSRRPIKTHPYATSDKVRHTIIATKRLHPNWGAQFIQGELRRRRFHSIPHRRTIERILYQREGFAKRKQRRLPVLQNQHQVTHLHQLWQIDFIVEKAITSSPKKLSFLNMRDVASRSSVFKYCLPAGRSALTSQETIAACRRAFAKWKVLPEAIRTDHGACFVGAEEEAFPSDFTLYLWGLGITHELIAVRRPKHNAVIERDQSTLATHFLADYKFTSEAELQRDVESFGQFHNQYMPSRSVRCQGKTAAEVAANLSSCARDYKPSAEARLFSEDRITARAGRARLQTLSEQ